LNRIAGVAKENMESQTIVEAKRADAIRAYFEALQAIDETEDNPLLRGRILFNLGGLWERQHEWKQAEAFYLQALPITEQAGALEITARLHLNLGSLYHIQQQVVQSKGSFAKAIEIAAKAGEPFIQGMAIVNLAYFDDDLDAMEVGLELLEQSGHFDDDLDHFRETYEAILKRLLEQAHSVSDRPKERLYEGKLEAFYQPKAQGFEVENTLTTANKPAEAN
jgi:tetratricopeptide (TPR) repeat protein